MTGDTQEMPTQQGGTAYTIAQAAARLGQDASTIRRHIKSGKLTATKDAQGRYQVHLDESTDGESVPPRSDGTTTEAALRAHIATLTAEVEARRIAEAELRRLLMQAQAMVPRLHDPQAFAPDTADAYAAPTKHAWWRFKRAK